MVFGGRGMAERGVDWAAVRRDVEAGRGTQRAIAARHGVGVAALGARKLRGGWLSPRDIARRVKMEDAMAQLLDDLAARLKRHSREAAAIAQAAKARPPAGCDPKELAARRKLSVEAGRDLSAAVALAADYQKIMERYGRIGARAAVSVEENSLERPGYLEVERDILARIGAGGAEADMGSADGV